MHSEVVISKGKEFYTLGPSKRIVNCLKFGKSAMDNWRKLWFDTDVDRITLSKKAKKRSGKNIVSVWKKKLGYVKRIMHVHIEYFKFIEKRVKWARKGARVLRFKIISAEISYVSWRPGAGCSKPG